MPIDCLMTLHLRCRLNFHNLINEEIAKSQCNEYVFSYTTYVAILLWTRCCHGDATPFCFHSGSLFIHVTDSPRPVHFKHSHWWKRQSRSKFASHYAWGTGGVCECKMDVKVYMDSYMASNGSCTMVTWIIFKTHLLEVGLTQNLETMALRTFITVDLFYFIVCEDPHE